MSIKIWIDDAREKPDDYSLRVGSFAYFLELLLQGNVDRISFDYDLDNPDFNGFDLARVAVLLVKEGAIPAFEWQIHSANPVGRVRLKRELEKLPEPN